MNYVECSAKVLMTQKNEIFQLLDNNLFEENGDFTKVIECFENYNEYCNEYINSKKEKNCMYIRYVFNIPDHIMSMLDLIIQNTKVFQFVLGDDINGVVKYIFEKDKDLTIQFSNIWIKVDSNGSLSSESFGDFVNLDDWETICQNIVLNNQSNITNDLKSILTLYLEIYKNNEYNKMIEKTKRNLFQFLDDNLFNVNGNFASVIECFQNLNYEKYVNEYVALENVTFANKIKNDLKMYIKYKPEIPNDVIDKLALIFKNRKLSQIEIKLGRKKDSDIIKYQVKIRDNSKTSSERENDGGKFFQMSIGNVYMVFKRLFIGLDYPIYSNKFGKYLSVDNYLYTDWKKRCEKIVEKEDFDFPNDLRNIIKLYLEIEAEMNNMWVGILKCSVVIIFIVSILMLVWYFCYIK